MRRQCKALPFSDGAPKVEQLWQRLAWGKCSNSATVCADDGKKIPQPLKTAAAGYATIACNQTVERIDAVPGKRPS